MTNGAREAPHSSFGTIDSPPALAHATPDNPWLTSARTLAPVARGSAVAKPMLIHGWSARLDNANLFASESLSNNEFSITISIGRESAARR